VTWLPALPSPYPERDLRLFFFERDSRRVRVPGGIRMVRSHGDSLSESCLIIDEEGVNGGTVRA